MTHENIRLHHSEAHYEYSVQPSDLDERFQDLLPFPEDFHIAYEKASLIAKDRTVQRSHVQQAILMLGYTTLEDIRQHIDHSREVFSLEPDYKEDVLEYVFGNVRSQEECKALTGVGLVNASGIKKRLELFTIHTVTFLFSNFSSEEICAIGALSSSEELYKAVNDGKLMAEDVDAFRALFSPNEQRLIIRHAPMIINYLQVGQRSLNITPHLRQEYIHQMYVSPDLLNEVAEKCGDYLYNITPINLAGFFSCNRQEREALIQNPYFVELLEKFSSQTLRNLEILKQHTTDDYLYVLRHSDDYSWAQCEPDDLEAVLDVVEEVFDHAVPWRILFPEIDNRTVSDSLIFRFAVTAIHDVQEMYGKDIVQAVLLSKSRVFDRFRNDRAPLKDRLIKLEEVIGKKDLLKLLHNNDFLDIVESLSLDKEGIFGRISIEQLKRTKEQFGRQRFLLLCQTLGGSYFIQYIDRIVELLPKETMDIIFSSSKKHNAFFEIGIQFTGDNTIHENIRAFGRLPIERQKVLVQGDAVIDEIHQKDFSQWAKEKSDAIVEAVSDVDCVKRRCFNKEFSKRFLWRVDILLEIFTEDQVIQMVGNTLTALTIFQVTDDCASSWYELAHMTHEDKAFFLEYGLVNELLKNPSDAGRLKYDYKARLDVLFEYDPLLHNQSETIVKRLHELQQQQYDVDRIVQRMVSRLSNPGMSDVDKIWYLYSRLYSEAWILNGSDPQLEHAAFKSRMITLKRRLEDVVVLNEDEQGIKDANKRNRAFERGYTRSAIITQPLLLHGKSDVYPLDMHLGFRAAEFLGVHQYYWGSDKTANALNFMEIAPGRDLITAYHNQRDTIAKRFGASEDRVAGITHVFVPADVEAAHIRYDAKLYDGKHHGSEHKLILCGVPTTTELCALINTSDQSHVDEVKRLYAKRPFYVPLIDVVDGTIVFSPDEYDSLRAQMHTEGSLVDLTRSSSVSALVTNLLEYYKADDHIHGVRHIERASAYIEQVCEEIYTQQVGWFEEHNMSQDMFEHMVRIAVAAHDLARSSVDESEHAVAGAEALREIVDYGLPYSKLQMIMTAIKQHNLPRDKRWSDDPITQALYDADKSDTLQSRGADDEYIRMILPTIQTACTRALLESKLR